MSDELVLIDREALLAELQHAFDEKTAEVLLGVLDKVAAQVRASGVTREDFRELRQIVGELAEAQRRTEKQVEKLIQAQRRTDERVGRLEAAVDELIQAQRRTEEQVKELAEAQRRTEERVGRLEVAVEELSRAVGELTEGMDKLRKQVGGLSDTVGGDIEDIAYIVLHDVLKREFGWKVGVLERTWQTWGEKPEEVNIFGVATDPARPEKTIWIVGEAKHNLTSKEVERFVGQVERAQRHLVGEIFPVCFCYRVRPEVQQQVLDAGIRLCFSYGKLV
jgi:seryl-tRNA synthetase